MIDCNSICQKMKSQKFVESQNSVENKVIFVLWRGLWWVANSVEESRGSSIPRWLASCSEGPILRLASCSDGPILRLASCSEGPILRLASCSEGPILRLASCIEGPILRLASCSDGPILRLASCMEGPTLRLASRSQTLHPKARGPEGRAAALRSSARR